MPAHAERYLIAAAALLFVVSLASPAVQVAGGPVLAGYEMLERGASAWRNGVFAWYANPTLVLALVLGWHGWRRISAVLALLGLALALSSFWAGAAAESAGLGVPAFSFAAGFYIWLSAFGLALLAALTGLYKASKFRGAAKRPKGRAFED